MLTKSKHSCGYILIGNREHPFADKHGYVPEHRLVMEKKLGRYVNPETEIVHHIDEDKTNNNIENLLVTNRGDHIRIHKGYGLIGGVWFKICRGCDRKLEVESNFYKRKDRGHIHRCNKCIYESNKKRRLGR